MTDPVYAEDAIIFCQYPVHWRLYGCSCIPRWVVNSDTVVDVSPVHLAHQVITR